MGNTYFSGSMTIVQKGKITGLILIALALASYLGTGMKSLTALIPAVAGLPTLVGSLVARNPDRLKMGMHIAALFGLLGFLAALGKIISSLITGSFELKPSTIGVIAMLIITGIFIILCVKSFREASRNR